MDGWGETDSAAFLALGDCYVPDREQQITTICDVIPHSGAPVDLVELCCGEGLLTEALLTRLPSARVTAFDGSSAMREAASQRLARFGERARVIAFELEADDWRRFDRPPHAIVSSLAIHHLDSAGKQSLYRDMATALAPGGALVIADLVEATTDEGRQLWVAHWDADVGERSRRRFGDDRALDEFRSRRWNYYEDPAANVGDDPSPLLDQLRWLEAAGLERADVHWLRAGHAIFSARKRG